MYQWQNQEHESRLYVLRCFCYDRSGQAYDGWPIRLLYLVTVRPSAGARGYHTTIFTHQITNSILNACQPFGIASIPVAEDRQQVIVLAAALHAEQLHHQSYDQLTDLSSFFLPHGCDFCDDPRVKDVDDNLGIKIDVV